MRSLRRTENPKEQVRYLSTPQIHWWLAQLVRALRWYRRGHRFKSCITNHKLPFRLMAGQVVLVHSMEVRVPTGSQYLSLAQLEEHLAYIQDVVGSNPTGKTKCQYRIAAIAADCKPALIWVRRFKSYCWHKTYNPPKLTFFTRFGGL